MHFRDSGHLPPETIFDTKQLFDSQPLQFDDQEVSGSGTSSSHSADTASTTISVSASTAGKRVRRTFRRFNYESGKSQLVFLTGTFGAGASGITRRIGLFDDDNGIFIEQNGTDIYAVVRSKDTGSVVNNKIVKGDWNTDKLDGLGDSGFTLDLSKSQIIAIDYEWLGVGQVRIGFVIEGKVVIVHKFMHANSNEGVYMSTPNLPICYEIENDGTGGAAYLEHICGTVITEGGTFNTGIDHWVSTGDTHVDANSADTLYAVAGVRLKSTHLDAGVVIDSINVLGLNNPDYEWVLMRNPTVAGTFTYSGVTNSAIETAFGATANTITGGHALLGGFGAGNSGSGKIQLAGTNWLGAAIDGTPVELVLCVRPYANNADIQGGMIVREMT